MPFLSKQLELISILDVAKKLEEDIQIFQNKGFWVKIDMNYREGLRIHYGTLLGNGVRESAIGTREYFYDGKQVDYNDIIHV